MSTQGLMSLRTDDSDITIFSEKDDLFSPDSLVKQFIQHRITHQINTSAYRAKLVVDAHAQLLLAQYQTDSAEAVIQHQQNAEGIAFHLGESEYDGISAPHNPFDHQALATAWNNGYSYRAQYGKPQQQIELEQKLWEEGIDTESQNSQFELAAITLYTMALRTEQDSIAERCKRLAFEMASYGTELKPTPQRQHQLNQFLALQTERIAQAIEIEELFNV
ncbi:MAG: hypothetical protein MI867_11700 [Pseudomonadales bacterium]|nr:hypothetical protein [Pseudomonadales bacterium]